MSVKIRFRFDGRCARHHRYNPVRDGRPADGKCEGCDSLYVIHLYTKVAKRRAEDPNLIVAGTSTEREGEQAVDAESSSETGVAS
jgi:hypothetical protein